MEEDRIRAIHDINGNNARSMGTNDVSIGLNNLMMSNAPTAFESHTSRSRHLQYQPNQPYPQMGEHIPRDNGYAAGFPLGPGLLPIPDGARMTAHNDQAVELQSSPGKVN